jgi:hypothetical protein
MGLQSSYAYYTKHITILLFIGTRIVLTLDTFQFTLDAFQLKFVHAPDKIGIQIVVH